MMDIGHIQVIYQGQGYHVEKRDFFTPEAFDLWSHNSVWVKVKGNVGQGQIWVPNKGRWASYTQFMLAF